MPRPRCPRPSHAACALVAVAAAALLPLAGCGASDSTARPNSAITASACQNKALVGTRMSCPPSASAPASH
ncbi:hypothetical protein [Paracidovorax wautersii]|uniref:Lipoprotein n=1 Tax=Paracidovorax wautersii TaxID=1177982 RepID=A0A1I2BZK2_9BURK|nr:hypothetical protein [Paracidovorax wautersii]SFE61405.1 hypothetical protein SAMN04489711_103286 [Paracidovorax wautersii]